MNDRSEHQGIVEPTARFEDIRIPLREPVHGLESVRGVLGIPEWWPTGSRVAVLIAHGSSGDLDDPVVEHLHRALTEHRYLSLRFNFPFAEAGKRSSSDSLAVLDQCYRAAIAVLGRDPSSAPAHLFLGGKGLGARVAAQLGATRVRPDGLFFLGFPLHAQDKPENLRVEHLYRVVSPMLFLQGTRDRQCDVDTLRRTLSRVGAPVKLWIAEDADKNFSTPRKSEHSTEQTRAELIETVKSWIAETLGET